MWEPVLCAEKDNVAISMTGADVRSFRIEAAHPVYLAAGGRNNYEADWTACDLTAALQAETVLRLPAHDVLPFENLSPHPEIQEQRAATLWKIATNQARLITLREVEDMLAGGAEHQAWGTPNCGKGQPSQVGHTGHPAAPARFRGVRVGVRG